MMQRDGILHTFAAVIPLPQKKSTLTKPQNPVVEKRLEELESSISAIAGDLRAVKDTIAAGFTKVNANFAVVGREIKLLHQQVDILNKKVDSLKGDTHEGFEDVGLKLENLTEEISKTGKVTNYSEYFENLKALKN